MQIYLVRHGETVWNKEEIFRGRRDVSLNEAGRRQADLTGRYFLNKGIARIFASPLRRAFETAEAVSKTTKTPIEITDALTDMDFGAWEGLELKEAEQLYPEELSLWITSPQRFRAKGGESLRDIQRRAKKGLQKMMSEGEGPIVLVTHRVLCKIIVLLCLRIPSSHFWEIRCDPASISLIERRGRSTTLSFLNDTCHLQ